MIRDRSKGWDQWIIDPIGAGKELESGMFTTEMMKDL